MPYDIFISYSHRDQRLRDELVSHLSNLQNQGVINSWHDGYIAPGDEWEQHILTKLDTAHIILLLISADFMASKFCQSVELKHAIQRHNANTARVIPIILRPVDWEDAPFAHLQALPTHGKPVTKWSNRDDAFKDITDGIKKAIQKLANSQPANP